MRKFFAVMNALNTFCSENRIRQDKVKIQFVPDDQVTKIALQFAIRDELNDGPNPIGLKDLNSFQYLGFHMDVLGPPLDDCTGYEISG